MRVSFKKRFLKQLAKLPAIYRSEIEQFAFETLPQARSIGDSGRFEKMQGYMFMCRETGRCRSSGCHRFAWPATMAFPLSNLGLLRPV